MRKPLSEETKAFILEWLEYRSTTGTLHWKKRRSSTAMPGSVAGAQKSTGYWCVSINRRKIMSHRIVWFLVHGEDPKELDHADGDKSNNRIENLRACNRSQNMVNTQRLPGSTGVVGLQRAKHKGKPCYRVGVTVGGKRIRKRFGLHRRQEAIDWLKSMRAKHYGDFLPSRHLGTSER